MVNHQKLKTNLKVAIQRLKLLERKKTEQTRKSTKEIADFIQINKYDRARIKVEHIIREDYIIEGMEIVEMYCDLLLARFGLVESMKELDMGLYECVSSLLWVSHRLDSECSELKVISHELQSKYGKEFAQMCRTNANERVNERLMMKMSEQAPAALLVEKYLVEIAKSHDVPFMPNPDISVLDPDFFYDKEDSLRKNNNNNSNNNNGGFGAGESGEAKAAEAGTSQENVARLENAPPLYPSSQQVSYIGLNANSAAASNNNQNQRYRQITSPSKPSQQQDLFELPNVPNDVPPPSNQNASGGSDDSFDALAARFQNLKK